MAALMDRVVARPLSVVGFNILHRSALSWLSFLGVHCHDHEGTRVRICQRCEFCIDDGFATTVGGGRWEGHLVWENEVHVTAMRASAGSKLEDE